MDQLICIKFCVKNEIKCNKVCEMLTKAYNESAMSGTRVYESYKRFQDVREDVEDNERAGRPSTDENVKKVKEMAVNPSQTIMRKTKKERRKEKIRQPSKTPSFIFFLSSSFFFNSHHHLNKNKKIVKKLARRFGALLAPFSKLGF